MTSPWLRFPRILWLCCAAAFLLAVPAFWMGPFVDDYFHMAILDGVAPFGGPLDLFHFAPGDTAIINERICNGPFPWWTYPELNIRFFRPLSSALIAFDHFCLDQGYIGAHIHSALWYVALVLACGLLFRRALPPPIAVLALVIFTLDEAHWLPTVWAANRNALVAAVPTLFGMVAYMKHREDGWRWGMPLALLCLCVGFSGGETTIGVLAIWGCYELFGTRDSLFGKIKAFLPVMIIFLAYFLLYKSLRCGAYGSGTYIDPASEPLLYLASAPARLLALVGGVLFNTPVDLWILVLSLRPALSLIGLAALALFTLLLWRCWPHMEEQLRNTLRWIIPGTFLSMLPVAATFPANRLLLVPSIGGSIVVAAVLRHYWSARFGGSTCLEADLRARKTWQPAAVLVGFLIITNFILPPFIWVGQSVLLTTFGHRAVHVYQEAPIAGPEDVGVRNIMIVAPDPLSSVYPPIVHAVQNRQKSVAPWILLSAAPNAHRLTRTGENTMTLEVLNGCMLRTEFEQLFRSPAHPFHKGDRVGLHGITIEVLETGDAGPSKIGVTFERSLDDPSLRFLYWKDHGIRQFPMLKKGESMVLPRETGLIGP